VEEATTYIYKKKSCPRLELTLTKITIVAEARTYMDMKTILPKARTGLYMNNYCGWL
jgi:hypothetical protein